MVYIQRRGDDYPETPSWPFPSNPPKPWTPDQEKAYQDNQRKTLPEAPL